MAEPSDQHDLLRDDGALRAAFRRGDRAAMERVFVTYLPLVRAICAHGTGNFRGFFDPLDRDDACQAIFAAAFEERSRHAYDGLRPYSAFLRGVAYNVARRMLDSRRRYERREADEREAPPDPEAQVIEAATAAVLRAFRDGLEGRDAEVFRRYYLDGEAEEHIARAVGITRYRARKIIAHLHKRMRRLMKQHGISAP